MNYHYFIPKVIINHNKSYKVIKNPNDDSMGYSSKKKPGGLHWAVGLENIYN